MEPIIISASFFQEQPSLGILGRTGEHEARRISFDCGEVLKTWPEATILCVCRRPCDTAAYPIPLTADGTTYTIPLTSRETAAAGAIKLELRAVRDDTVLKSAIFYGRILPSLNGQKDAPGNPLSDALNRLESTIANAQTLADEIRQKLDNGEFVGERGPQGDKGDKGDKGADGSDASVTAQNIEAALGYVPVTPSDLAAKQDALTDADRQSITKTGMTTGAAWTSDEQKEARERMGVDKPYELIEEITLAEESTVARSIEPDGTPYNFAVIMLRVEFPASEKTGNIPVVYHIGISSNDITSYFISPYQADAVKYGYSKVWVENGLYRSGWWTCVKGHGQFAQYFENPVQQDRYSTADGNIISFTINTVVAAGTKIMIYGVRA